MGQIDSGSKSNRLLASRRYTHNTFNTAQESFTNVLDLRSEEIYTRAHLIPSSSLPHSGSSQKMAVFSKNGQNVTKYWYRHKLTKSNTNNEVWFFLNPTGSDDGVGAQLINDNQQTSFISPKYSTSALANATTEDATPGYLALVYKSTATNTSSLSSGDIVSTNDYQFDYKTGVLQFRSSTVDPTDSQYLYMSVYQYVGQNLRTGLEIEGPFTASNMSFGGDVTGSSTSTGSFGQVFVGDRLVFKDHQDSGEYIESDGTDLSINVGANGDINIPANIGMTFGNDGEKIEGDGTNLTLAGGDINLTAETDINVPANVGLTFGNDGEKIEGDGTDMTIASSGALTLSSDGDTTVETVTFNNGNVTIPGDLTVTGDRIEAQVGSLQVADHTITVGSGSDSSALMHNGGIDWGVSGSVAFLRYRHAGTALSSSAFLEAPKLTVDTITIDAAEIDATGALDIDTGGDLTLSATGDVNIPADIGLTFGNDGEKIEGDGTDLTIASSNLLNLTATTDVKIPVNVGLMFGTHEKIESDDTDLSITVGSGGDINIPADVGITFGDDGEKIEGDGTDLTISGNKIKLESSVISGSATSTGSFARIETGRISGSSLNVSADVSASNVYVKDSKGLYADKIRRYSDSDTTTKIVLNDEVIKLHAGAADDESLRISGGASGLISGSSTSTGSFARIVADGGAFIVDNAKVSGSSVTTGSFGRLELAGNANIDGNITLGGSINIGDADTDDITLGGEIKSNIIPDADATYDLGSSSKGWNDLHLGSGGVINLDGGDVTLTHSSNLVTITGGSTRVDKLEIDSANDHIDIDTDMVLTAAADITLTPGGANVKPGSDSAIDLGVSGTAFRELFVDAIDLNGQGSISIGGTGRIDLDGDDDTSIRASADDIITFEAGAVDIAQMTATQAISGSSIATGSFSYVHVSSKVSGSSVSTGSFGRLEIGGNGNIDGNLTLGGNITIGDADSDSITINADLTSNLIPNADNTFDLGSSAKQWKDIYVNGIGYIDQLGTDGDAVAAYISSGEIDGTVIGGESAAAATFTTVTTTGNVSGSSTATGSFGRVQTAGDINASGRVFENNTSVIDHATAMAIVFGG